MYVGIDLAAKEENETGICILDGDIEVQLVFKNHEIIKSVKKASVAAMDAPLTESEAAFRPAERELMSNFGPMLPLNTPGMKTLSEEGKTDQKSARRKM